MPVPVSLSSVVSVIHEFPLLFLLAVLGLKDCCVWSFHCFRDIAAQYYETKRYLQEEKAKSQMVFKTVRGE